MENMIKNETRRDFLKVSGSVAGGLALGFYMPGRHNVAVAAETTSSPNAWPGQHDHHHGRAFRNGAGRLHVHADARR